MIPAMERLLDDLERMPGVVAVVLGGSRAEGSADAGSDWDLGVYYRGAVSLGNLERWGTVHPPGSWGRIMNGGAWLEIDGTQVDVLLRDLDVVEHFAARAARGDFDVDHLLGYVAGVPSYLLVAELALAKRLRGALPEPPVFPEALAESAPARWRFCRDFTLDYAHALARRGDTVAAAGQAAKAILEEAHARLCERREWVLNEKRLVERAGLGSLNALFAADLERVAEALRSP
jgi:hypothetical protein